MRNLNILALFASLLKFIAEGLLMLSLIAGQIRIQEDTLEFVCREQSFSISKENRSSSVRLASKLQETRFLGQDFPDSRNLCWDEMVTSQTLCNLTYGLYIACT